MDLICSKCGARHWKAERLSKSTVNNPLFGTCCLDGKVQLPAVRAPPRELLELYNGTSHYSKEFLKNIPAYNAAFALASLGVTVDKSVQGGNSPYVFKIQGALHHKVGSLLPAEGQEPIYAQLYFYSPEEANAARMRRNQGLNSNSGLKQEVMNILDDVLRRNHAYIPLYKTAYERIKEQQRNHPDAPSEIYAWITCAPGTDAHRYNAPTANDVAAILLGDGSVVPDHRDIILHERGGPLHRIHETHPSYQPLLYVLLFPYGEDGYHTKIPLALQDDTDDEPLGEREAEEGEGNQPKRRQMVSLLEYYAYRLHQRVTDSIHIFQSGPLLQQWIVDAWAATDQYRLT
ncbi:hypothetical protein C8J57DRAFT_1096672 [Mycena rebaudengoi]|nr:hypothetical protein C8J57DRAFT_1096672 [Mycena rebaudengoi]